MHITRIQVEEGFLDGLDISLPQGLITFIGARGTGKTSIIELIRFCLGAASLNSETSEISREHALSILDGGQVTLTLQDGPREITVSRMERDEAPRATASYSSPIIFSQTEIENIGLQPAGRLRILDGFATETASTNREEGAVISEIRSLTEEMSKIGREIEKTEALRAELPAIEASLAVLKPQEDQLSSMSDGVKKTAEALEAISSKISEKDNASRTVRAFLETVTSIKNNLWSATQFSDGLVGPPPPEADIIAKPRKRAQEVMQKTRAVIQQLDTVHAETDEVLGEILKSKLPLEENARALRKELEQLKEGSSTIVRQSQTLRTRKANIDALKPELDNRKVRLSSIRGQRDKALDKLEGLRVKRSESREEAIGRLNKKLGPRIRLSLERAAQHERFASAITEALKGSGLKYNELAYHLARRTSPRELMECVENNDVDLLAELAETSKDRAIRIISNLKDTDLGLLSTTLVEDDVSLELLDGKDYKDIGDLSTGQRCTVVLPIILQHTERLVVVDQPEDHIDNAFIADTLIVAIQERADDGQLIFTTHNANIPVLGDADCVVEMGSDGRRGFAKSCAPLLDQASVAAITQVMEGGISAFKARAKFYQLDKA